MHWKPLPNFVRDAQSGKLPGIYFEKVKFDELVEDFLTDYRINKKKSLRRAEHSVKHLKEFFEGMRVQDRVESIGDIRFNLEKGCFMTSEELRLGTW
jgi:hypothetical protein